MNILISNDDGIKARALDILRERLSSLGNVTIVAPEKPRNAMGNSLTLHKPVRVNELGQGKYSVSGTPADCVRIGILTILDDNVDMVISGINEGANLGDDVRYSGTVAGAKEAVSLGVPAIASSLVRGEHDNFEQAADITMKVVDEILKNGMPERKLLNLNIPDLGSGMVKGIKVTRLGVRIYDRKVTRREDPLGRSYYWIVGEKMDGVIEEDTDFMAISMDYASLTPLVMDYTDYELFNELKNWNLT